MAASDPSPGQDEQEGSLLARLPMASGKPAIGYGFAIVASAFALWLRFALDAQLPPGFPFLTFFPAVIVTAFVFGLGPGLCAGVLLGLASWYWFIPPDGFAITYQSAVALNFYVLIVGVDVTLIHWMQRATRRLSAERERSEDLARTREMLFKELQHRVGNNLQMVASLLALQKRGLAEPEAVAALADASRRVALVGRIQRTLYSAEGTQLRLSPYLESIVRGTIEASGRSDIAMTFDADGDDVTLEPSAAIPAALVVAEAVSNAIEHGFAARGGTIALRLYAQDAAQVVEIADDGAGLPEGFSLEKADSLGLRIARSLARSFGGNFDLAPAARGGTLATVRIAG